MIHHEEIEIKITIVGAGGTGKTSLLTVYKDGKMTTAYRPTRFENSEMRTTLDTTDVTLKLHDTAGQEDFDKLRPNGYHNTDIFLVCFALNDKVSFNQVRKKWVAEIKQHCPRAVIILVGTKLDLMDEKVPLITRDEARDLEKKIKAKGYYECSAKTRTGVDLVFEQAVRAIFIKRGKSKGCCQIL